MSENYSDPAITDAWYANRGPQDDVAVSGRIRFARNLANFAFPERMDSAEYPRVFSIVQDAFNSLTDGEEYSSIESKDLDPLGVSLFTERGYFNSEWKKNCGLIIRADGRISCNVNAFDHIRLSGFETGLSLAKIYDGLSKVDDQLQKKIQYAASYEYGYLTSLIKEAGSGIKFSQRLHLPALELMDKVHSTPKLLKEGSLALFPCFGVDDRHYYGGYYDLVNLHSRNGTEFDQLSLICSVSQAVCDDEREARKYCIKHMESSVRDKVYKVLGYARSALLLCLTDAIDIIGNIKFGIDTGVLTGATDTSLNALLFRIKDAHIQYVLDHGHFKFENDIEKDIQKRRDRLRALILQEAFENLTLM